MFFACLAPCDGSRFVAPTTRSPGHRRGRAAASRHRGAESLRHTHGAKAPLVQRKEYWAGKQRSVWTGKRVPKMLLSGVRDLGND